MDLQTPCCNACMLINRKPAPPKLSFSRNNISIPKYRCKTVSELQSTASVNGGARPSSVPSHKVTVHDRQRGVVHEFYVPEDQYILHTAEDQDIKLPFACRHGCCTSCAVRIKSGELKQPEALGISAELKSQGYALLCVGFPSSDLEVETQDEDEVVYYMHLKTYFCILVAPLFVKISITWKTSTCSYNFYFSSGLLLLGFPTGFLMFEKLLSTLYT
ncbi:ferredoxin-1, chloroplastic isoform X1 [Salvia miltiorrhiza]|uniref:ferredoxin-1, chloroplastic isoform X1 n=1 Tax=Salvia miltiorrhiza TaxID=226208 RepID=UPI0025ABDCB2|nr:ferredoxin-1, chloroplastic isoform X1 [Salvia miltiorrhiza]XP_057799932.1 ferredoxin-1, chloroplastic isoform X1 [Salvia miltiorrhiza]